MDKAQFDDFIQRLRYHHRGEGVNDHCTRDPLFIVERRDRIYGFDPQYGDTYVWLDSNNEHTEADERTAKRLDALDDGGRTFRGWEKVYYEDRWKYVSAHLTKEAAQAYIVRKKHDYAELRVYVDCQLYCNEFNAIIAGLLDGKITFTG